MVFLHLFKRGKSIQIKVLGDYFKFDFDLQKFASTFGLNIREIHYALKILESQSLIFLNDAFFNPSKIKVIVGSSDFYNFQIKDFKNIILIKCVSIYKLSHY